MTEFNNDNNNNSYYCRTCAGHYIQTAPFNLHNILANLIGNHMCDITLDYTISICHNCTYCNTAVCDTCYNNLLVNIKNNKQTTATYTKARNQLLFANKYCPLHKFNKTITYQQQQQHTNNNTYKPLHLQNINFYSRQQTIPLQRHVVG